MVEEGGIGKQAEAVQFTRGRVLEVYAVFAVKRQVVID